MIVIKEPHALKVSFVTVVLKARHHHVSWGSCVAVFVYALVCFVSTSGWASPSCWSLLVSVSAGLWHCALSTPTHKCTHAHRYTRTHTWAHTQCTQVHTHTHRHIHSAHTQVHTQTWVHTVSSQPPFPGVSTSHSLPLSPFPSLHITFSSFANVYFQCSTRPTPLEPEKTILLNTEKYL